MYAQVLNVVISHNGYSKVRGENYLLHIILYKIYLFLIIHYLYLILTFILKRFLFLLLIHKSNMTTLYGRFSFLWFGGEVIFYIISVEKQVIITPPERIKVNY